MAQNDELQLALKIEADNSIENAAKKLDKVADAYDDVEKAAKKAGKTTESAMSAAIKEQVKLKKAADDTREAFEEQEQAARDAARNAQLDAADKSGDKASIAGSTRGALDALSGGNAGAIGQLLEGAEAVFDLGEAAGKVGGPLGDVVTKLGPGGLAGIAAVAGVALVAVSLAFKKFTDDAQKQADQLSQVIDARIETAKFVAGGGTSEEAEARKEELEAVRKAELQVLAELKASYDANITSAGLLGNVMQAISPQEEELANSIKELEASTAGSAAEITQLEKVLQDGSLAANDAAAAEAALAEERTAAILAEAQQAGELASLKARVGDLTQEQIDSELEALKIREAGLKAEIAALKASGDTSAEVTKKIASLTSALGFLGEQSSVLKSARPGAKSEAAEKAADDAKQAREAAARERERASSERKRAGEQQREQAKKAQEDALKQQQQFEDAINKLREDTHNKRVDQEINNARAIEDIIRGFGDQRTDALAEQNFLALAQINKDEKRAARDQSIDNKRAKEDINRESQRANNDLLRQQQQYQQQRSKIETAGYNAGLKNTQAWASGISKITMQMAQQFQAQLAGKRNGDSQFREQSSYVQRAPRGS
jgi:hypothetical protein